MQPLSASASGVSSLSLPANHGCWRVSLLASGLQPAAIYVLYTCLTYHVHTLCIYKYTYILSGAPTMQLRLQRKRSFPVAVPSDQTTLICGRALCLRFRSVVDLVACTAQLLSNASVFKSKLNTFLGYFEPEFFLLDNENK